MLNFFGNKPAKKTKCLVLYTFKFERGNAARLFDFLTGHFNTQYRIQFPFAGFHNETYEISYGSFDAMRSKIASIKSSEIVNLALDLEDVRKNKRSIGVEFNITRPIHITVFYPEDFPFNMADFINQTGDLFLVEYGFTYLTTEPYWITSYAIADSQHYKGIIGVDRVKQRHFDQWLWNCEKIREGYIRDIYMTNIISRKHLSHPINEMNLEQLINHKRLGTLQKINSELYLWDLDDIQLSKVKTFVYETDLII